MTATTLSPLRGEHTVVEITAQEVERALGGDRTVLRGLVLALAPVVQARVVGVLLRRSGETRNLREETEDLTQEVFAHLFAGDARVLRQWSAARGLSLRNFVGLVAQRLAFSRLRTLKHNPWTDTPTTDEDFEHLLVARDDPEAEVATRRDLAYVVEQLQRRLSAQGREIFELLVIKGWNIEEICAFTGLSQTAAHAWRSRLLKAARALLEPGERGDRSDSRQSPRNSRRSERTP